LEGAEKPMFEGREIVLGPRAGDYYLVKVGLTEGEQVVTNGNFKIDSALQIQAKPSMMNPEGQQSPHQTHQH
jgi:Cu(I)/Ag(I) efflux system membrane fusion protein